MPSKKDAKINLHNILSKKSFNNAVICTFTFDPVFFEEYCLAKFNSLNNNANITVITDKGTYEKAILGSEQYRSKQANIRYLLYPISVPGVFHPKIFLFTGRNKGRLVVGSANFTRPGLTSNAELVASYDFEEGKITDHQKIFQAIFKFLYSISQKWSSDTLSSNLQLISRDAPWLISEIKDSADSNVQFFSNLEAPLLDQIISVIEKPIKNIWILSRYFDQKPDILNEIVLKCKPNKIKLFTQNVITTLASDWLKHTLIKKGTTELFLCEFKDGDHYQPLHAKSIIFEFEDSYMMCFGSANFTTPALLRIADKGNLETLLLVKELKKQALNPRQIFDPSKSAIRLKDPNLLISATKEEDDFPNAKNELKINEAILLENKLKILAIIPEKYQKEDLILNLTFYNQARKSQPLTHINSHEYTCEVSKDTVGRLEEASTIAQIVIFKK